LKGTLSAVLVAGSLLTACSGESQHIANEPLSAVYSKLTSMPKNADVMDLAKQAAGTDYYLQPDGGELVWHFRMNGNDYCRLVARLEENSPTTTRVTTRAEDAAEAAEAAVAKGGERPDYRYLCNVARIAGEESVTATLEGRPAQTAAIWDEIRKYVATNPMAVMGAANAAMDEAIRNAKSEDPSKSDDPKRRADWESLQRVREEERANQPPLPSGAFRM
jgi:hypothetical protein